MGGLNGIAPVGNWNARGLSQHVLGDAIAARAVSVTEASAASAVTDEPCRNQALTCNALQWLERDDQKPVPKLYRCLTSMDAFARLQPESR